MSRSEVLKEYEGACLGVARLDRRLVMLASAVSNDSEQSFPKLLSESELEGAYRFLGNDRVTSLELLRPHQQATLERAKGQLCIVAHDTTTFSFRARGKRRGLGTGTKETQVLHAHVAMAVDGSHNPLGTVSFQTFSTGRASELPNRWRETAEAVSDLIGQENVINVFDREADQYPLLTELKSKGIRYVVRAQHDRVLETDGDKNRLKKALSTDAVAEREVWLGARTNHGKSDKNKKTHPERGERAAVLCFSATTLTIKRPSDLEDDLPQSETLNVVRAWERQPPDGEDAVEWILLTTESVATAEDVLKVVDYYSNRWVIEEFFKALKSGCSIEERQLETEHSLTNAIALFLPVAWNLLSMRTALRKYPNAPATQVLSSQRLLILRASARRPLPEEATVQEAILAIAGLGGHLKRNGPPGWITLSRGWDELMSLERGFRLAQSVKQKM